VLVKGGYTPDVVVVERGKPVRLNFVRQESAPHHGTHRVCQRRPYRRASGSKTEEKHEQTWRNWPSPSMRSAYDGTRVR
jgi:hypothetical protein